MLVSNYRPDKKRDEYKWDFIKAKDFNANTKLIPKKGIWVGQDKEFFELPEITIEKYQHNRN